MCYTGGANIGNTTAWRANLWTSLDKWSNNISSQYNQIHVLHRTLVRRRDASSQKTLLEECNVTPIQTFVSAVSNALQQELRNINSSAKQALNMEYPKALRLVVSLWNHFSAKLDVEGLEDVTLPNVNVSHKIALLCANTCHKICFFCDFSLVGLYLL